MHDKIRTLYRIVAIIEALTWAGLLVGMAFKYLINGNQLGVRIFGSLHGAAFITYVGMTFIAARAFRWSPKVIVLGLSASIPPFTTLLFDRWVERIGGFEEERGTAAERSIAP